MRNCLSIKEFWLFKTSKVGWPRWNKGDYRPSAIYDN